MFFFCRKKSSLLQMNSSTLPISDITQILPVSTLIYCREEEKKTLIKRSKILSSGSEGSGTLCGGGPAAAHTTASESLSTWMPCLVSSRRTMSSQLRDPRAPIPGPRTAPPNPCPALALSHSLLASDRLVLTSAAHRPLEERRGGEGGRAGGSPPYGCGLTLSPAVACWATSLTILTAFPGT